MKAFIVLIIATFVLGCATLSVEEKLDACNAAQNRDCRQLQLNFEKWLEREARQDLINAAAAACRAQGTGYMLIHKNTTSRDCVRNVRRCDFVCGKISSNPLDF